MKNLLTALAMAFLIVSLLLLLTPPRKARLAGLCQGEILFFDEEDQFPANCDWIEVQEQR